MTNIQFSAVILLALLSSGTVACTDDDSDNGGSGGQSTGGSHTGGTSATSGGTSATSGGTSATSGGSGGQSSGGTSATSGGSGGQSSGGATTGGSGGTAACEPAGTLTVTNDGVTAYLINGNSNPDLTLCRMNVYTFELNAPGHPFYIKTIQGAGTENAYDTGVTGNGTETGTVTFDVPMTAPDTLFYDCAIHPVMTGTIHIVD